MEALRRSALGLAVFVLAAALLAFAASAQKSPPKFYVHNMEPDLGTYYEGQDIDFQFTVRNHGAGELHILGVRPG